MSFEATKYVYFTPWLMNVSICFSLLLDFVLKFCGEVDIHFVLFEFVVVLLWETMTFYWIIWVTHTGNPMGITLLTFNFLGSQF